MDLPRTARLVMTAAAATFAVTAALLAVNMIRYWTQGDVEPRHGATYVTLGALGTAGAVVLALAAWRGHARTARLGLVLVLPWLLEFNGVSLLLAASGTPWPTTLTVAGIVWIAAQAPLLALPLTRFRPILWAALLGVAVAGRSVAHVLAATADLPDWEFVVGPHIMTLALAGLAAAAATRSRPAAWAAAAVFVVGSYPFWVHTWNPTAALVEVAGAFWAVAAAVAVVGCVLTAAALPPHDVESPPPEPAGPDASAA